MARQIFDFMPSPPSKAPTATAHPMSDPNWAPPMPPRSRIYLIGSLRNPDVPKVALTLREAGFEVFDDWYAAGPHADDAWRDYEIGRGRTYAEALNGDAAEHVFDFDLKHLRRATAAILVLPAGKSGHMELGWMLGQAKLGYVLLDTPDRWDVMYKFASGVYGELGALMDRLRKDLQS